VTPEGHSFVTTSTPFGILLNSIRSRPPGRRIHHVRLLARRLDRRACRYFYGSGHC
jgi:hypothetical protein